MEMSDQAGFRLTRSNQILVHAILDGAVRITTAAGQVVEAGHGEIVILLSGDAHKIRSRHGRTANLLDIPSTDSDQDRLPLLRLGSGDVAGTLLSGSLDVSWPGGTYPGRAPNMLSVHSADLGIDIRKLAEAAAGPSASTILTKLATLIFVTAFRNDPRCRAQFRLHLSDPIARAKVLIEKHPFRPWSVRSLASEVGMGRSNFAARFTARHGVTPIDALTEERMKHAEILLRTTNLKIVEISERIGFRSDTAFFRRFTAQFGQTPSKWRRAHEVRG